jgi:RNase P subunit RPR2
MTDQQAPIPLSKSDLSKVARWLTKRVKRNICPCCDETAMVVWPYMTRLPLVSQSGESGQRLAIVIECRTCGYLRSFSAAKIGLAARGQSYVADKHIH